MSGLYYRVQLRMFFSFVLFTSVLVGWRVGSKLKQGKRYITRGYRYYTICPFVFINFFSYSVNK